ncbi:monocarboxylate transporter 6 [Manduca sexta]|uniref:Monocarboxylate transporter n=1 Tax=Manduca sexta TaxID=7130 RepID=A0A921ZM04_MANSE|nr:monocarboxylate transporter 6 [Manduca sexta]KAG6460016.1 hypothetical protein O3G_MSEX011723 [Manduca sexta]
MDPETKDHKQKYDSWGLVVCFGTIITFIAGIGHVNSFGLIYIDFMNETGSTAKSLTTAHGVFAIMLAVGGILLNIMSNRIPLQLGGLIGAVLFTLGSLLTIIISNTNQLPITFGVLQGIGFGIMVPVCYSTFNYYFVRKRTAVMSLCKSVQGIILIWYPLLMKRTMNLYGMRGTLLIIFGISLHTIPGMLSMKKKDIFVRSMKTASDVKGVKESENVDLLQEKDGDIENNKNKLNKIRRGILEVLNLKVLKDPVYCNICIGQSFVNFSDLTFFILLPMLLFQHGYDKSQVATCISIGAGADVAGRCLLTALTSFVKINTRTLFFVTTLLTLILRILLLQIREFVWVATATASLGVLRAWLHIASPLIISDQVSHEDFPAAYALFLLAAGIVNVTCSPFIGMLKDYYEDYIPAFYALTACCIPCLVLWPIELLLRKK